MSTAESVRCPPTVESPFVTGVWAQIALFMWMSSGSNSKSSESGCTSPLHHLGPATRVASASERRCFSPTQRRSTNPGHTGANRRADDHAPTERIPECPRPSVVAHHPMSIDPLHTAGRTSHVTRPVGGVAPRSLVRDHPGMTHLTHGWEPDLEASDSLLRRYVIATADRGEAMARAIGGRARRTEVYSAADPASPVMFDNAVVVLQPSTYVDLHSALVEALAWYPPERPLSCCRRSRRRTSARSACR